MTNHRPWVQWSSAVLASVVAAACGGGSDTPAPAPDPTLPLSAVGVISGFGSVIVNGVRYDDSGAAVQIDDATATRAQLRVGMVIELEGRLDACPNPDAGLCTGTAARIRFRNNLVGPISTVNRLQNTITVMGQTVELDEETVVEGAGTDDVTGLQVGDVVAVNGLRVRDQDRSRDRIRARLLERTGTFANGSTPMRVDGEVTSLPDASGLMVGPVRVRVQASCGLPAGGFQLGQWVEVTGRTFGANALDCDRVQTRERTNLPDASAVELEGYVSEFASISHFKVDGQWVNAAGATLRNGSAADLANGVRVEAKGVMGAGVLVASRLIVKLDANVQVQAPMQVKQVSDNRFTVLGKTVAVTTSTQFVDKASPPSRTLSYADLLVGDRLDVRGFVDTNGVLVASRVVRTAPDPLLVVKAKVDAKVPDNALTIFGIGTQTGPSTRYRDADGNLISASAFYSLVQVAPALPSVVRAQGVAATLANTVDASRSISTRGEVELSR